MTVSNNGPAAAAGVKVLVSVPPGFGFASATGTGWTCSLSVNLVICDLTGTLAPGGSAVIVLNLTAPASIGQRTVNASVTSTTADTNTGNNAAAAIVDVTASDPDPAPAPPSADLSLAKTVSVAGATTGDRITYSLMATNHGPDAAENVVMIDTLPTTITFVSAGGDGWVCSAVANIVTCSRPSLASGASSAVQIVGTANRGGRAIVNAGSISSSTGDPSAANNTATATIDVTGKADIVVTKTASSATFVPGRRLSFTITVTNRGPDDVSGARVQDVLPEQLEDFTWTCSAISGRCGSFSGRGSIDQLIDVSQGGSVTFALVGTVRAPAPSAIANSASAAPPQGTVDPNPANNSDRVELRRDRVAPRRGLVPTRLKVTITPPTATVTSGIPVPATIVTKNVGKATARNVLTCVSLPPGITVAKAFGGFALKGRYCWRTKSLAAGARVTFKLQIRGDARLAGQVRLVAAARASNAPLVGDTSRLVVLSGRVTHQGGYTG